MNKIALAGFFVLLAALAVVHWFDPRVPHYRSEYDPLEPPEKVARWYQDLRVWSRAPRWSFFALDAQTGLTGPSDSDLGKPDWSRHYVFGKFRYNLDVQARGGRIHYLCWGVDEQKEGGAWMAVGEGMRQADGRYFTVWSCLDLSNAISNGGGAWFEFSADKRRIFVRYYHDTFPFGGDAVEEGEAAELPRELFPPLEGRVPTHEAARRPGGSGKVTLWGRVVDEEGAAIAGAAVKRRAHGSIETHSDARGFFKIEVEAIEQLTLLAAGKFGYQNGIVTLDQDGAFAAMGPTREKAALATITLRKLDGTDHRNYEFVSPQPALPGAYDPARHLQCGNCHRENFREWQGSRHATMAVNPLTRTAFERDARPSALALGKTVDECTPCHSPSLAATLEKFDLRGHTLMHASGVHLEGNHCDFCHKIAAVPRPDLPGMAGSIALLRPNPRDARVPGAIKRVFGPLPDVSYLYMGAAYNPLFETGALCAGCHEHTLENGIVGQGTYSEWKQTKYAQPGADYQECQGCHMPRYNKERPQRIGLPGMDFLPPPDLTEKEISNNGKEIAASGTRYRPLSEAHKHTFIGSDSVWFMQRAIAMKVETRAEGANLRVIVTLENIGAGHAIPTGHGLKRLVLHVSGKQGSDRVVDPLQLMPPEEQLDGPASGTVFGRRFSGANLEGAIHGKTGGQPNWSIPFWRADYVEADTRLWPGKPRTLEFHLPNAQRAEVRLYMRRISLGWLREHGQSPGRAGNAPLDVLIHDWK